MFQTKVAEKLETRILRSIILFSQKSYRLWANGGNYGIAGEATEATQRMRTARRIPKAGKLTQTQNM